MLWRYLREAIDVLTATAPDLAPAAARAAKLAYAIIDGALIPDRTAEIRGGAFVAER